MRLAQTNLQLYQQLMAAGWEPEALAVTRGAYDLACELFLGCYRPSHKPFDAHLVGVASALARWQRSRELVWAGLLHSAYLYGDFGDGERGVRDDKRRRVRAVVGANAEALVHRYGLAKSCALEELGDSEIVVLRLADLADECSDGGVLFAPEKGAPLGVHRDAAARARVVAVARDEIGESAAEDLAAILGELEERGVPPELQTSDRAFQRRLERQPTIEQRARAKVGRLVRRVAARFSQ